MGVNINWIAALARKAVPQISQHIDLQKKKMFGECKTNLNTILTLK